MKPAERWVRVRALLEEALDLPAAERPAWLAAACGSDAALRADLEALLAADASESEPAGLPPDEGLSGWLEQ
ncbi:MAG: hypothetical protein WD226_11050, partial [Planctomycetota bacterium]